MQANAFGTTFRKRRIKCDEAKPECNKCSSTGRSCEGYGIWGGGHTATANHKACAALSIYQPSSFPVALSQQQLEAFSHFQQYLTKKIPGVFESGFWSKLVIQASVQEPAVLHSTIALAAFQSGDVGLALDNYNRAIINLRQHLKCNTKYALRLTLISCMLFICLELVRGDRKASEIHLQNGLRLLSDLKSRTTCPRVGSSKTSITLSPHTETSDDCIVEAFTRLNVQSALFGQASIFLYELPDDPRRGASRYSPAFNFGTVAEARQHLDFLMNGVLRLSSQGDLLTQEGKKITNGLYRKRRSFESSLDHWMVALQSSSFVASSNVGGNMQTRFGTSILRIYHSMIKIMVATCLRGKDEMIYDRYTPDFTSLLQQIWQLWTQATVEFGTIHHENSFTADMGYIPPLYYASLRCRDPNLRRIAIDLLARAPHKEGAWDGRLLSATAKKVMEIEEGNIYQGYELNAGVIIPLDMGGSSLPTVPAPARINNVTVIPNPTRRYKATVKLAKYIVPEYRKPSGRFGLIVSLPGASVVILARNPKTLQEAKGEIMAAGPSEEQTVHTISVNLSDHAALRNAMSEHNVTPDMLICSVGGTTPDQIGFLADLEPEALTACFSCNYHASLFITQWCVQRWVQDQDPSRTRRLVYIASGAAFVALPGYTAYTPAKTAVRALADTLRQELLLYGDESMYRVHIAFPGAFITDSFIQEQTTKPELLRNMEGINYLNMEELLKNIQSAEEIAAKIFRGIRKGRYIITTDLTTDLTLNNMRGPSPRDSTLYDVVMSFVGSFVFPMARRRFDRMTIQYGLDKSLRKKL
ncbi:hypothetical protein FGADI_9165 [Fusarium gaditjirri]|uniref:Zn(2)-C6 fungal-type domain-containing protein n=1 Tax=Fusarium gaditjirri TaxID=282569 RepID=A0A8H4T0K7_9HYPO|nr:hypothetical protein FGADI_9165 [Fusarium gaditjirri]